MGASVRMDLLKVNVAVEFVHVLAKRLEFLIKVLLELLASNLLCAAIND